MVAHAKMILDQARHPRTAPQRGREAVGFGALQQQRFQAFEFGGVQQRFAAGPSGLAQTGLPLLAILPRPLRNGLAGHLQSPRRLTLIETSLQQPHRLEAALLQRLEIPLHTFGIAHAHIDARQPQKVS